MSMKNNNMQLVPKGYYQPGAFDGAAEWFVGRLVKIAFEVPNSKEWMWVKVVAVHEGDLIGVLDNVPMYCESHSLGDPVRFKPADVVAVH